MKPPTTAETRSRSRLSRAWRRLTAPSHGFLLPEEQRPPRMLASCALALIVLFCLLDTYFAFTLSDYHPPWPGYLVLLIIYGLSRSAHYRAGAVMLALMFPCVSLTQVALGQSAQPAVTLGFASLSPLVGALFLSLRWVPILGIANLLALALLPWLSAHSPNTGELTGTGVTNAMTTVLALLYLHSRNQREVDRSRSLSDREESLRLALAGAGMGHWDLQIPTGRCLFSPRTAEILGLKGRVLSGGFESFVERVHQEERSQLSSLLGQLRRGKKAVVLQHRVTNLDGSERWVEIQGQISEEDPKRMLGTIADVTERRKLDERQRHGQKMEAMGRLAGGVAHDFNNLLTVVLGNVDLLRDDIEMPELDDIERAALSARALTTQLLSFSRQSDLRLELVDLRVVVQEAIAMAKRILGNNIHLDLECPPVTCLIRADSMQIQQGLLNLLTNGRDAMPEGGTLAIRVSPAGGEDYVSVSISDTGSGIADAEQAKIFDAFYTTKPLGKGTGLGLAMVRSMMEQSGGSVRLESTLGVGSTFSLYFSHAAAGPMRVMIPSSRKLHRGETVLLLEDEEGVRKLCQRMLEQEGYVVIGAASAQQALDRWEENRGNIDLLVSDVAMPGETGPELAARLLKECPELPVLFISGYTPDVQLAFGTAHTEFLRKPFGATDFLKKIRRLLDNPS